MILQPGERVGDRFTVESLLGAGGTAHVYRVRHATLGSTHALKLLTPGARVSSARLLREGQIQATLRHPCVVPVTDIIEQDGQPGLVMEYVPGPSLADLLARRRLSHDESLAIFARILAGVGAAHAAGVLHRDIKPHNVLLAPMTGGWMPKVADFGIARAEIPTAGDRRTRVGLGIGTPGYMAPEQARGEPDVDRRADVYSLGVLLGQLLTGELELGEDLDHPFVDPEALRLQLALTSVGEAVARAVALDRIERFADVATFAGALYADRPELLAIAIGDAAPSPVPIPGEERGLALAVVTQNRTPMGGTLVAAETMAPPPLDPAATLAARTIAEPAEAVSPARGRRAPVGLWVGIGAGVVLALVGLGVVIGGLASRSPAPSADPTVEIVPPGAPASAVSPPVNPPAAPSPGLGSDAPAVPTTGVGTAAPPPTAVAAPVAAAVIAAGGTSNAPSPAPVTAPTAVGTATPPPEAPAAPAAVAAEAPAPVVASEAPTPEAAVAVTYPDVRGSWDASVGGRPVQVRIGSQSGARVSADVVFTLGVTERAFRYVGTVDPSGALSLREEGGAGRLDAKLVGGALSGTVSTGAGKGQAFSAARR